MNVEEIALKLKQDKSDIIKIVLFGPESSGKTTLARQLARYYNSVWVEEYARPYLQNKWNNERKTCEQSDLIPIAIGQMMKENDLVHKANKVLLCDTDLLETMVYSETYYGEVVDPVLKNAALENTYDIYLLCNIDIPWEADDLRDRPERRIEMFEAFKNALEDYNRPYYLIEGSKKARLSRAIGIIDELLGE